MDKPARTSTPKQTHRRRLLLLVSSAVGVGITAAACGAGASSTGAHGGGAGPASSGKPAAISTHPTSLGNVLAGRDGRSLYLFEKDHGTTSSCTGACASLWPPVTSANAPSVSGTARQALLGTTHRSDGTTQVTYAGHPLYYFAGDHAAGDVTGEGLKDFGASWYVVSANGDKIDND